MREEEVGWSGKQAGRGCPDPRSQHWPDSEGGGGEGDRGMLQAKETLSAAASFKTDLL